MIKLPIKVTKERERKALSNRTCGSAVMRVEGLSKPVVDMEADEVKHFIKAFLASLNIGFPVEFRTLIKPYNLDKYVSSLEKNASTFKIVLEENPSLTSARRKLRELEKTLHMINDEGITPLRVESTVRITACGDRDDLVIEGLSARARMLRDALNSIGIRVSPPEIERPETKQASKISAILKALSGALRRSAFFISAPTYAQALLFPFLLVRPSRGFRGGMPLGRDPLTGESIWWDPGTSASPHVLVVGPTGSGKTTFLAHMVINFREFLEGNALILDLKGEYRHLLTSAGVLVEELILGRGAGFDFCRLASYYPKEWGAVVLTETISESLGVDKDAEPLLYEALDYGLRYGCPHFLRVANDYLSSRERSYVTYKVRKVLNKLRTFSSGSDVVGELMKFVSGELSNALILNLSRITSLEEGLAHLTVDVVSKLILQVISNFSGRLSKRWGLIVVDEGWMYIGRLKETLKTLLRLGRSYKLSVAFATQSPDDLSALGTAILSSSGVLLAMSSSDPLYWKAIRPYMRLTEEECIKYSSLLTVGEGLLRMGKDGKGRPFSTGGVKLQTLQSLSTS